MTDTPDEHLGGLATYRSRELHCPACGRLLDGHSAAPWSAQNHRPRAGAFTVCIGCAAPLRYCSSPFYGHLDLRPVNLDDPTERAEFLRAGGPRAQAAVRTVIRGRQR